MIRVCCACYERLIPPYKCEKCGAETLHPHCAKCRRHVGTGETHGYCGPCLEKEKLKLKGGTQ